MNRNAMGPLYGNIRKSGGHDVVVHNEPGSTLHAYLGFIAADRSRQSDSVYLGKFEF